MPYEEDKDPVEKINAEYEKIQEDKQSSSVMPGWKPPSENPIDENQSKIEKLNNLIDERMQPLQQLTEENSQKIDGLIQEVSKIANFLSQATQGQPQPQAPQPAQVPEQIQDAKSLLNQLPPEVAASALNGVLSGVAQLVAAWKSGGGNAEPNQFAQMSQEITTNLLRAGVDGIMQNVYHNYNPVPPSVSWQGPGNQPQPQQVPRREKHTLE